MVYFPQPAGVSFSYSIHSEAHYIISANTFLLLQCSFATLGASISQSTVSFVPGLAAAQASLGSSNQLFPCSPLQRRQEQEYYTRLEAERRRQHEEGERKLLTPDEPGLYRPPLPRDYQPPSPASTPATNNNSTPPPPPQRNTSYLKNPGRLPWHHIHCQVCLIQWRGGGGWGGRRPNRSGKLSATRKSYGDLPPAPKPQPPPTARKPRPVSDGIFLSNSFQLPAAANTNSTAPKAGQPPLPPAKPSFIPSANSKGRDAEEREGPHLSPLTLHLLLVHLFSCLVFFVFVCSFFLFSSGDSALRFPHSLYLSTCKIS